jgi:hypothetical protein
VAVIGKRRVPVEDIVVVAGGDEAAKKKNSADGFRFGFREIRRVKIMIRIWI